MDTTLLIEADGQSVVQLVIDAPPDLVFEDTGIQGPPGPAVQVESGDGIMVVGDVVHVNINSLTFAP
jgi:hypothetical protein